MKISIGSSAVEQTGFESAGMIDYGPDRTVIMQKWILLEGNQ